MDKKRLRKLKLKGNIDIILGKDEIGNDQLMKEYEGKENTILHTSAPGSPFAVIEDLNPSKNEIYLASVVVAKYSQDWRDNKKNVKVDVFTGKDISKPKGYKAGTWKVNSKGKSKKTITIKKEDILEFEEVLDKNKEK